MSADAVFLDEIFLSIQGEAGEVGRPHLFLRLAGCPLRCTYCDTPRSWKPHPEWELHRACGNERRANPVGGAELRDLLLQLCAEHEAMPQRTVLAVTGGEPLEQADFLAAFLPGWPGRVLLETAGILPERLERLLPEVDFLSLDWKLASTLRSGAERNAPRACLEAAARAGRAAAGWVKIVVAENVDDAELATALQEIAAVAPGTRVFLQPATPVPGGPPPPAPARLLAWLIAHDALDLDLRVLPQTHPLLGVR
jgi:organic radical activating enzyme